MPNQSSSPKVCIVMATYRPNPKFLEEQIQSLIAQDYRNWTCVITDDNSDPDSIELIKYLISKDSRFSLIYNMTDPGAFYNFENGLKAVPNDAEFICMCDQDDIWKPNKLSLLLEAMQDPSVSLVHTDLLLGDKDGKVFHDSCWQFEGRQMINLNPDSLIFRNVVTGMASMFRRSVLEFALPFPRGNRPILYYHDHWIAVCSLIGGGKISCLPVPTAIYRQHGGNLVGSLRKRDPLLTRSLFSLKGMKVVFKKCLVAYSIRLRLSRDFLERINQVAHRAPQIQDRFDLKYFRTEKDYGLRLLIFLWTHFSIHISHWRGVVQVIAGKIFFDLGYRI